MALRPAHASHRMSAADKPDASTVAALVARARSGDREAYDALVRTHFVAVYSFLHRLAGNPEDAEDLAQETFVRAHAALERWRGDASFATWLFHIARHLEIDRRRARAASQSTPLDADLPGASARDASDEAQRGELVRRLSSELQRLPEHLRAAIVLRILEGREYDEIGAILGVRPATARTQVMQARRMLLRRLGPELGEAHGLGGARGSHDDAEHEEDAP